MAGKQRHVFQVLLNHFLLSYARLNINIFLKNIFVMFSKQDLANMLIVFFLMDHLGNVSNQTLLNSTAVNPTQTVSHLSWKDI